MTIYGTTIEVTVRRRIRVRDDQVRYLEFFAEQGIQRIDCRTTVAPFVFDEDLVDAYVVGKMTFTPEPTCSVCGGAEFRYDESTGVGRSVDIKASDLTEQGGVLIVGGSNYYDGDDYPGLVCATCEASIDLPDNVDIDWS